MKIKPVNLTDIPVEFIPPPSIKKLVKFENVNSDSAPIEVQQKMIKSVKQRSKTPMPRPRKAVQEKKEVKK